MTVRQAMMLKLGDQVIVEDQSQMVGRVTSIDLEATPPTIFVDGIAVLVVNVSDTVIKRPKRRKRNVTVGETRVCSAEYGVTSLSTSGGKRHMHRRVPCEQCPFRMDVPTGVFPAQAFRESAPTAYDGSMKTFACHMSGLDAVTCAGFLHRHDVNNTAVRISRATDRLPAEEIGDGGFPIYPTYREMAIANGVAPDDPCLEEIRGNMEQSAFFRRRHKDITT